MRTAIQLLAIPVRPRSLILDVILLALTAVSALAAEPARPESASPVHDGLMPPLRGLEEVGWQDVNLRGGFWGSRLDIHHKATIPHVLDRLEERRHIANFDVAAGALKVGAAKRSGTDPNQAGQALEGNAGNHGPGSENPNAAKDGEIVGHSAFDSDVHKALEGACYTLGHFDDPALRSRVEGILDRIVAAQEADGYLVSYFTAKEPANKWANLRLNHEMYNAGHFFEFAVAHHQLTGETKALEAATRFADHIDRTFGHGKRYDVDGHQEVELALVKLYRATGEKRYLDLCRFFLEERGHVHGAERKPFTEVIPRGDPPRLPGETVQEWRRKKWSMRNGRMQDHKPVLEQTEAVGHAVRAGYMYAAMTDLARFSEAPDYAKAVRTLWDDVVRRKMYLTGGLGTAQYGDEGFGDPYLLPNNTYCESCACMAHVLWQHRMNLMEGDAKYADVMELTLYNSAIAGLALSGKGFFYQNPLESRKGAERSDWIGLACCPTSHARFTPQVGGLVYARKSGRIFVNLYAAGVASIAIDDGRAVKICQETGYPWDGGIRLTIGLDKPSEFDLCVRIPGWALGKPVPSDLYRFASTEAAPVSLKINGKPVEAKPGQDGYVHLERSWEAGDKVTLDLPMPVRRVHAHEKVEANKGKAALMRGPVVYCLEGVDNKVIDLFKLSLPRSAETTTEHDAKLLGGVTVIRAEGLDEKRNPVKLTAIPYFAWANREKGPMTVWIPESGDEEPGTTARNRWSAEKANEWYAKQTWPCGFNYVPAHAISYTEMWMPYNFDAAKVDRELALAEDIGFNCLRVVLPFVVWEHDPAAFKKRLDEFLAVCDRRGLRVMFALFDDCAFGSDEALKNPHYGKQPEVLAGFYANGWTPSPGHDMVRNPETWPRLEKYVRDILTTYRDDRRVWVWDLYNEPTNGGLGDASLPLAEKVFEWARAVNPAQPLTLGTWNGNERLNELVLRHSDILTFHNYGNADRLRAAITALQKHGRPVINTEWLCRHLGSTPEACLPLFTAENVGCMHWGLVNGRTQTHLPWGARPGKPAPAKWQHDLFHGDHSPYEKQELELFRNAIGRQTK